ncbi:unnamed protein product, partial [marine sediment metagenome]
LREGIFLRAYGQKDPLVEYKREGYEMFSEMMANAKEDIASDIFRMTFSKPAMQRMMAEAPKEYVHKEVSAFGKPEMEGEPAFVGAPEQPEASYSSTEGEAARPSRKPFVRTEKKIGPNDPCPCGSGKKYKRCCGAK